MEQTKKHMDMEESTSDMRQQFEAIMEKPVTMPDRTVTLRYKSCCGCGCDWVKINRVVPFDSPLKNGDKITELLGSDEYAD